MNRALGFGVTLTVSLALLSISVFLTQTADQEDLFGDYYGALIALNI